MTGSQMRLQRVAHPTSNAQWPWKKKRDPSPKKRKRGTTGQQSHLGAYLDCAAFDLALLARTRISPQLQRGVAARAAGTAASGWFKRGPCWLAGIRTPAKPILFAWLVENKGDPKQAKQIKRGTNSGKIGWSIG